MTLAPPVVDGSPTRPRLTVIGYGNVSRADDALGPLLLARLAQADLPGVTTLEDYQLQIEHALDLVDADLVLFVDAGHATPAPWAFYETHASQGAGGFTASSHALLPEAVLAVYRQVQGREPPPAFVLCVRGEVFELGAPMSALALERLEDAWMLLRRLCESPSVPAWRTRTLQAPPLAA